MNNTNVDNCVYKEMIVNLFTAELKCNNDVTFKSESKDVQSLYLVY